MTFERDLIKAHPFPPVMPAIRAGDEAFRQAIRDHGAEVIAHIRFTALKWPDRDLIWISSGPGAVPAELRTEYAGLLREFADVLDLIDERETNDGQ